MKSKLFSLGFALGIICFWAVSCDLTVATDLPPIQTPPATILPEEGTWETFQYTSQALADNLIGDPATRTIHVYLPPGYDVNTKRYPVVFGLHGFLEDPTWLRGMGLQLDTLIANGEALEMVLVFPDGDNLLGGSNYISSPTIGDYERYIVHELVAFVDANYRTIDNRDARGITGCSMGGNGSMHLAFNYPEIFSAVATVSGGYAYENYPVWEQARAAYSEASDPKELNEIVRLPWYSRAVFSFAAATASNPDNAPFYFDFPFEIVNGETKIVPDVWQRISDGNVFNDVQKYLDQPSRLNGIAIFHGVLDDGVPLEMASTFSNFLTSHNVEHEYYEVEDGHCDRAWDYSPMLKFMSMKLEGN